MTPEIARVSIEAMFGTVRRVKSDIAYTFPSVVDTPPQFKAAEVRLPFKAFTQDGEHELCVFDYKLRETPEEALSDLVSQIEKVSDKEAELYWRAYPTVQFHQELSSFEKGYFAMCRIAWWKWPVNPQTGGGRMRERRTEEWYGGTNVSLI